MTYRHYTLDDCAAAVGTVVVIDVLRAFSTAAFAFAAGVNKIILAESVEDALSLNQLLPETKLMGEVDGKPIPGFHFSNSPAQFLTQELSGLTLIQRTTAGTKGAIHSRAATHLLAGSFCCAQATVDLIRALGDCDVSFVITGRHSGANGDEDAALADYLICLLEGDTPASEPYLSRIATSSWGAQFGAPSAPHLPREDLMLCSTINRFDFAIQIKDDGGYITMTSSSPYHTK